MLAEVLSGAALRSKTDSQFAIIHYIRFNNIFALFGVRLNYRVLKLMNTEEIYSTNFAERRV